MDNAQPIFSPDGTKVAFFSAPPNIVNLREACEQGYALRVFDIETGEETVLSEPSRTVHVTSPPAWSPDGEQLAFIGFFPEHDDRPHRKVHTIRADGTDFRTLLATEQYHADAVVWSDANTVLFSGEWWGDPEAGIYRVSLASDSHERVVTEIVRYGSLSLSPDRHLMRCEIIGEDQRYHDRVFTLDGRDVTTAESHRLFRGQWRLTSRRASP
ncbi:MAG: hypothetical protein GY851_33235 [bacterium]|nr:hypothetical protein [bacterium]